ncbi:Dna2-domain-containing protein [Phellopilus nigrolimitatus]|nr:Dna2-domain-containing protein [Phellopilus nigrolimitatus]
MTYAKPTVQDEASFMEGLLSGIDSSFFDAVPSPDPTPKKPQCTTTIPRCTGSPSPQKLEGDVDLGALLEGAEDWDWDDMNDDLFSSVEDKSVVRNSTSAPTVLSEEEPTFRCIVETVELLQVVSEDKSERRKVILTDDWLETDVRQYDTLNIIGLFSSCHENGRTSSECLTITVSAKRNLLILHPDLLITATSVANAPHCSRRPLLSLLLRSSTDATPALVWGNMLHEIIQRCFTNHRWDAQHIETAVDDIIRKGLNELVRIGVSVEEAKAELGKRAGGLRTFGDRFIGEIPKPEATLTDTRASNGTVSRLAITQLHDVEEDIWVPKYGLKGKIDVSVQARIEERIDPSVPHNHPLSLRNYRNMSTNTMPLEIKTGRAVAGMEHRAQTMLYTLLMAERYGVRPPTPTLNSFPSPASTSNNPADVPAGLLYYTQSEEVIRVPAGRNEMRGLIMARNELAGYLMRRTRKARKKKLVNTEGEAGSDRTMKSEIDGEDEGPFLPPTIDQERACGRCYVADACMLYRKAVEGIADDSSPIAELYDLKIGHLSATHLEFFRKWEHLIALEEQDLSRFRKELWTIHAREREQKGRCLSSMILDPTFRLPLKKPNASKTAKIHQFTYRFVRQRHSFTGITKSGTQHQSLLHGHIVVGDAVTVSVMDDPRLLALVRGFVLDLTPTEIVLGVDHVLSSDFIRERSTRYSKDEEIVFRIDKDEMTGGMARVRDNLAQLFYVSGSPRRLELLIDLKPPTFTPTQELCLNPGMPGTGKTTTVAEIIRVLVRSGKTVLLTSYTHSAVDTILLKLKNSVDFDILRLGNADKVHPEIHEFMISAKDTPTTVEQLERQLLSPPVVATTAYPRDARKGGLDVSLFRRLSDAHPNAVLIYGDRLKCGSVEVARRSLQIPLKHEADPAFFVDTDLLPAMDSHVGDLIQNEVEASLVQQLTTALLRGGVGQGQIGIISLYRQQIKLLSHLLQEYKDVEILTADRSQGRDKDCIIVSLVRANENNQIGDLLKDWRRINVAFTRARAKLVIFGSRKTLQASPLLADFFGLMDKRGWVLSLPRAGLIRARPILRDLLNDAK